MKAIFVETSAFLRIFFGESGGKQVATKIESASRVIASRLLQVEANRALLRLQLLNQKTTQFLKIEREFKLFWQYIDFVEMTKDICDLAGNVASKSPLRALDAIHLATYFRICQFESSLEMLSFDKRILAELR